MNNKQTNITRQAKDKEKPLSTLNLYVNPYDGSNITDKNMMDLEALPIYWLTFTALTMQSVERLILLFKNRPYIAISILSLGDILGVSRTQVTTIMNELCAIGLFCKVRRFDRRTTNGSKNNKAKHKMLSNCYFINPAFTTNEGISIWKSLFGNLDLLPKWIRFNLCYLSGYKLYKALKELVRSTEATNVSAEEKEYPERGEIELNARGRSPRSSPMQGPKYNWAEVWHGFIEEFTGPPNKPMDEIEARFIFGGWHE